MKAFIVIAAIALCGCEKYGTPVPDVDPTYNVVKLFTNDGCTLYRFNDGRYVYYSDCRGGTHTTYSCGKGCTAHDDVETR